MTVRVFEGPAQAAHAVARIIAGTLTRRPASVLGLPTGRTAIPVYDALVRRRPAFSRARTFNLDEFVGLTPGDPRSFRTFMNHHLFSRVNIPSGHVHFLNGAASDLDAECARFERAVAAAGGIDLLVLGIGVNGHVGFNEPGTSVVARTHRARLTLATRRANAAPFGGRLTRVPREALSMGMGTILAARAIVLIATGRSKARAIERMLAGRVTPALPASFLQLHRDVHLVLDRAAAERL
jgi:glucosamine-6-phosphate deaminase